jgi:hypothetical protein
MIADITPMHAWGPSRNETRFIAEMSPLSSYRLKKITPQFEQPLRSSFPDTSSRKIGLAPFTKIRREDGKPCINSAVNASV